MSDQAQEQPKSSALLEILNRSNARRILSLPAQDVGLAEHRPYPFVAIVGQVEMRIALLLAVINPNIGGVLLIGPRGTGKTTAVRSVTGILPDVEVSDCEEGVLAEDLQSEESRWLYPDCYEKYHAGGQISHYEPVKLVELPLNARLEDVVGGVNERIAVNRNVIRLERGILARADNNLLYVDEVNLLDDQIVDAILDAAAQGQYTVRRGAMAGTYRSRFVLIGSMNPEEGRLRPQILDRFGLRVNVRGLTRLDERMEVYQRMRAYRRNPTGFIHQWELNTAETLEEVVTARERIKETQIPDQALQIGLQLVEMLKIDSHRADYTLFEAARAYAAADSRTQVTVDDIRAVAPLALRQRRSEFMDTFFESQQTEDEHIQKCLDTLTTPA
ncbi:MAG: ATP-binding protein [Anaerolineae bacterium]|jgi:magnesium chelatase subunit I|nr:ATP-binding protein [Anaerolineae bacterium]